MKPLTDDFYDEIFNIYQERRSSKIDDKTIREFNETQAGDALYVFCLAMNKLIKEDYFSKDE